MIIQRNFSPSALPKSANVAELTGKITGSLAACLDTNDTAADAVRIHLDWVQYKTSFRDPVMVRRSVDRDERPMPLTELSIDLRQANTPCLPEHLSSALGAIRTGANVSDEPPVLLDGFRPWRDSIIWPFNRLFWERLSAWEQHANRGFEAALPSGGSDANHPEAVGDSAADFCTLLRDLEVRGQLPAEIYAMEIGVGSGARARLWLDTFKSLDDALGTGFYPRLRFLLGDYSPATLETALAAVGPHAPLCSVIAIDATNPF